MRKILCLTILFCMICFASICNAASLTKIYNITNADPLGKTFSTYYMVNTPQGFKAVFARTVNKDVLQRRYNNSLFSNITMYNNGYSRVKYYYNGIKYDYVKTLDFLSTNNIRTWKVEIADKPYTLYADKSLVYKVTNIAKGTKYKVVGTSGNLEQIYIDSNGKYLGWIKKNIISAPQKNITKRNTTPLAKTNSANKKATTSKKEANTSVKVIETSGFIPSRNLGSSINLDANSSSSKNNNALKGDVNSDGKISPTDVSQLQSYLVGNSVNINKNNADLNGDGKISITDLSQLKNIIVNGTSALTTVIKADGLYSLQPMCAPNMELTVENASDKANSNVCIFTKNSHNHNDHLSHQKWYIKKCGYSSWYNITAENSGLALNIHNGIPANGTNVTIYPAGGAMHQFKFLNAGNGYYILKGNIPGDYVLTVENSANRNGANVNIREYNGSSGQMWKLVSRKPGQPNNDVENQVINKISHYTSNDNTKIGNDNPVKDECRGFANFIYQKLFVSVGKISDTSPDNFDVGKAPGSKKISATITENNIPSDYPRGRYNNKRQVTNPILVSQDFVNKIKNLFSKAKSGAFIQMARRHTVNSKKDSGTPHSAILYKKDNAGCTFYEANAYTKNKIEVNTYTWQKLADRNLGFTIYEPENYTLK